MCGTLGTRVLKVLVVLRVPVMGKVVRKGARHRAVSEQRRAYDILVKRPALAFRAPDRRARTGKENLYRQDSAAGACE